MRLFDWLSKMVCVFINEVRNIRMTIVIETSGFYKEEKNFIYSVDNVEMWKKAIKLFHNIIK